MTIDQNCSNRFIPLNKMAARAKVEKTFKRFFMLNRWINFEIISQAYSLDDSLPILLKQLLFLEQNGRQG